MREEETPREPGSGVDAGMARQTDGDWIRQLRERLKLSQVELAARLGVSSVTVSRWERGHVHPGPATMRALLHVASETSDLDNETLDRLPATGNLPRVSSKFFGRHEELLAGLDAIGTSRVVTLVGPAGCGKTRLAIELGYRAADRFAGGVWLIDLAPVADPGLVLEAAARALAVSSVRQTPLRERIAAEIAERHMLVLVDNCEHVAAAAADLIELLSGTAYVRVVATSRSVLGVPRQRRITVGPLPLDAAVSLFVDRAGRAGPSFGEQDVDAAAIADVCTRLDGLPLAIELASARTRVLSVAQIARRLDDRFAILGGGDAGERHASLHAALEWSHELLDPTDRAVFRRLGVFAGSFDIDAAEAVCRDRSIRDDQVLDTIDELARQSLVTVLPGRDANGAARYRLLETIRDYARARLNDAGEVEVTVDRLAGYLLPIARTNASLLGGAGHRAAVERLDEETDNLLATIELAAMHGLSERELALGAALWPAWHATGRAAEAVLRLERALTHAVAAADATRAEAMTGAATLHTRLGNLDRAAELAAAAAAGCRNLGEREGVARALDLQGVIAQRAGALDEARLRHEEALAIWRAIGDRAGTARALNRLGQLANVRGDEQIAERHYVEAWSLVRGRDNLELESAFLLDLGEVAARGGRFREALGYLDRAFVTNERLGNPDRAAAIVVNRAEARLHAGEVARAVTEASDGVARYRRLGNRSSLADALYVLGVALIAAGRSNEGAASLREAVSLYADLGHRVYAAQAIEAIAGVMAAMGAPRVAARWLGGAEAIRDRAGVEPYALFDYAGTRAAVERSLGTAVMAEEMAAGRELDFTRLVLDVLHHVEPGGDAPADRGARLRGLTDRQREVLRLVVDGRSNREIAATLGISERTVERHLSAIYAVLDVDRRGAAIARAVSSGIAGPDCT